jgi:membrane-associated phospholipid phosphatase
MRAPTVVRAAVASVAALLACLFLIDFADQRLAEYFSPHADMLFEVALRLTRFGEAPWWLIPTAVLFVAARFRWRNPLWAAQALFVFASVACAGIVSDILKILFGRARPGMWLTQQVYGFAPLHLSSAYQSFPSGHAACVTAACLALALVAPRYRVLWIVFAILVGASRVIVTTHYASDVIGGMVLALWSVLFVRTMLARRGLVVGHTRQDGAVAVRSTLATQLVGRPKVEPAGPLAS